MAVTDRAPLSEYVARRDNGTAISGASIRVYEAGTLIPTAVYSAQTGSGTLTQPLTADSRGRVPGWVVPAVEGYDLEIEADGTTYPEQRIRPATPSVYSTVGTTNVPRMKARKTTTQSAGNGSLTPVTFNVEDYDTDTMFTAGGSTVTIKTAGIYLVTWGLEWAAAAGGYRSGELYVNGSSAPGGDQLVGTPGTGSFGLRLSGVYTAAFAVNDALVLNARQNSGGALNIAAGTFAATLLVPA